jgi:AMP-polyphosphate phosphotransferase
MFEAVELGHSLSKADYRRQLPELRLRLIEAQQAARQARIPVLVLVAGMDGAGKGEAVHHLNEWLDPRGIDTHTFWNPSGEEEERPYYWRFWRTLPARGRIGIYYGGWYNDLLSARIRGGLSPERLESALSRVAAFERMLVEDGALIVKFWFHLSRRDQRRRLRNLANAPERHQLILRVTRKHRGQYEAFVRAADAMIRGTDTAFAPWHLVEATQARYRDLTTGRWLLEAMNTRLQQVRTAAPRSPGPPTQAQRDDATVLDAVDLSRQLGRKAYAERLPKLQAELNCLTWKAYQRRLSSVLVFEGWDAAGKGSGIRRVTEAVDARLFRVIPVGAPTEEELGHHYLWRFWRQLPRAGLVTLFDRSWYGRVLVERVEGLARPGEWRRAYHEINEFEKQLTEHGIVVLKFWIHISRDEQLIRFRKREQVSHKNYKITPEDWRNRKRWRQYELAVHDMVTHTATENAPWILVSGNDKEVARLEILESCVKAFRRVL